MGVLPTEGTSDDHRTMAAGAAAEEEGLEVGGMEVAMIGLIDRMVIRGEAVTHAVVTHAVVTHAAVTHAAVTHAVVTHAVVAHAVVTHAVVTHAVVVGVRLNVHQSVLRSDDNRTMATVGAAEEGTATHA
jgi:hypothetical protein